MNTSKQILLVLFIATLVLGYEQSRSGSDTSAGRTNVERGKHTEASESGLSTRSVVTVADATGSNDASEVAATGKGASDTSGVIDFPLLEKIRWVDLIDMEITFPEALQKLNGRRVSLIGFMAPFDSLKDMRRCMIVPSYVGCKFCSPPKLSQVVFVTQGNDDAPGKTYPFIESAAQVSGIFRLSRPDSDHEGQEQGFVYSIENAIVTPHSGEAPKRAPGHGNAPHKQRATGLPALKASELVKLVADLIGREPIDTIEIKPVSEEAFGDIIRSSLKNSIPETTRTAVPVAFRLLGLLPDGADWIDTLAEHQLARRVAVTDETGKRIYLLDSVPEDHAYVRLELVSEIAVAIARQNFPEKNPTSGEGVRSLGFSESEDSRRARTALQQGFRTVAAYRFARSRGIPAGPRPPVSFVKQSIVRRRGMNELTREALRSVEFDLWQAILGYSGSFFVDFLVGDTGPLSNVQSALSRPPSTTMECFRPRWYEDGSLWRPNPVPADFADKLMDAPPVLTDVLGIGGLVPMLAKWYAFDTAKSLAGGWAGDRYALWQFPDGGAALMLEVRWRDEASAIQFRDAIPRTSKWKLTPHEEGGTRVRLLRADSTDIVDRLFTAAQAKP